MAKLTIINLVERGQSIGVSTDDLHRDETLKSLLRLQDNKIITINISNDIAIISPGAFVGNYRDRNIKLTITPKAKAATKALLDAASNATRTLKEETPDSTGKSAPLFTLDIFLSHLRKLFTAGIPWSYGKKEVETSSPRGKLLITQTIKRFYSKGIKFKAVCEQSKRVPTSPSLRQIASTALNVAIEARGYDPQTLSKIRLLIEGLPGESTAIPIREALRLCRELPKVPGNESFNDFVLFMKLILTKNEDYIFSQRVGAGVAEFINMERVWERVTQRILAYKDNSGVIESVIHPLRKKQCSLFDAGGPIIDPDVIVYKSGRALITADAKYKEVQRYLANDVYQLDSYCNNLKTEFGFLIYISKEGGTHIEHIGKNESKSSLYAIYVGTEDLKDLTAIRKELSTIDTFEQSLSHSLP